MTYDQDKATDRAGDDADVRPIVSSSCADGTHSDCDGSYSRGDGICECDCHSLHACTCYACGTAFECTYKSTLCDACLDKPLPRPVGVFEP